MAVVAVERISGARAGDTAVFKRNRIETLTLERRAGNALRLTSNRAPGFVVDLVGDGGGSVSPPVGPPDAVARWYSDLWGAIKGAAKWLLKKLTCTTTTTTTVTIGSGGVVTSITTTTSCV